jgi:hypothetical protein
VRGAARRCRAAPVGMAARILLDFDADSEKIRETLIPML